MSSSAQHLEGDQRKTLLSDAQPHQSHEVSQPLEETIQADSADDDPEQPEKVVTLEEEEKLKPKTAPKKPAKPRHPLHFFVPDLHWIPKNFTWPKLKPAIRVATMLWIETVFFIVPQTNKIMGPSAYQILVAGFMSPPSDPFVATLEREILNLILTALAYAWSSLGVKLASLARHKFSTTTDLNVIYSGIFVEAGPTIIMAVFLFTGSAFFLWLKASKGPGPYSHACTLACMCLDNAILLASVYPYPVYVGDTIMIPVALHSGIALFCSVLIFPETLNAQFAKRMHAALVPLLNAIEQQPVLLSQSPMSPLFDPKPFMALVAQSEAALAPLAASARLIKRDVSWGRFGAHDLSRLHAITRRLTVRANGLAFYFKIIDPTREKFPVAPDEKAAQTRPPSPEIHGLSERASTIVSTIGSIGSKMKKGHFHLSGLHNSLFRYHGHHNEYQEWNQSSSTSVGVIESHKYLNLEGQFQHPKAGIYIESAVHLLGESTSELLVASALALKHIMSWLQRMNSERYWKLYGREHSRTWQDAVREDEEAKSRLRHAVHNFREKQRKIVLDPYRAAFKENATEAELEETPPHRYLFQSYMYQYHLLQFSLRLCEMLEEVNDLEKTRHRSRLWTPVLPLRKILLWEKWEPTDHLDRDDDEDPGIIQGIEPAHEDEHGKTGRRDPDALRPGGPVEIVGNTIRLLMFAMTHGNVVFALKGAILTVLLSIPSFLPHTAEFAYVNKFVWAISYGQFTISRFRGDTAFVVTARIIATFLGGLGGMAIWYISSGIGKGNPFGLAATMAVCLPFFAFYRLYWPGPTMTNIITFVTLVLVVGMSWQEDRTPSEFHSTGTGFNIAWKRFVLVTAGVTAAFFFSFLPPSTTLRRYIRLTYATTAAEMGQLYCNVVSFANAPWISDNERILKNLLAVRAKLNRSKVMKANVVYELTLRGKWPAERYERILEIQLEIAYLLSHMKSVINHLEPAWGKAFLLRTRFLESDFQGDTLAVISMISTALRIGIPLPQITPCPLLDRFMAHHHNSKMLRQDAEDGYGLPKLLNIETLENEQYLCFSVGVSTAYGIVTRLDRLMLATKELVGEQYHIHGVDVERPKDAPVGIITRTNSIRQD
ncbi:hypothetical protein BD410DRAFT_755679 [Rickenella mellea]|uniref:DUF2421 domain-containing protein n=1 Tax=Rickenella mellea TaxID=50990 RepID=A0A4Y7PNM4_9AGAM|nr:hypothetical protein BD410DRAFT_755679 [Rickenella mellea]